MHNNELVKSATLRRAVVEAMVATADGVDTSSRQFETGIDGGDATMRRVKQASKAKRVAKAAVPALGAAGLTFGLAGSASAATNPAADAPQKLNFVPSQSVTLGEEEIADVSLATFHLFDKEQGGAVQQMAWGCRCGGCGCRGCRCGGCGCRCGGCGGCGCGPCCYVQGYCRIC
jgi:hypothetical protein